MPSVVEQTPYNEYTGNGVATVYPYEFELLDADDLVVTIDGVVVVTSDFTLAGVGVQAGGTVTFDTAPGNLTAVLLSRELALQREIDYQSNGDLASATVDLDFNRLWQALQGFWARITNSIRAPFPEQLDELPPAADRASKLLAFDSLGQPTVMVPVSGSAADVLVQLADTSSAPNGDAMLGVKSTHTGAVATTQHEVNQRTVSVWDYMSSAMKADAVAGSMLVDCTAAFNAATQSTVAWSDALAYDIVAHGRLRVDGPVYVRKGQTFSGTGHGTYINAASATGNVFVMGKGLIAGVPTNDPGGSTVKVSSMFVLGGNGAFGTIYTEIAGFEISSLFLSAPGIGIECVGAGDGLISNIETDQCLVAYQFTGGCQNIAVSNFNIYLPNYAFVIGSDSRDITFSTGVVEYTQYASVYFADSNSNIKAISFTGVQFVMNSQYATFNGFVYSRATTVEAQFANCSFRNMYHWAINQDTGSGVKLTFTGCVFDGTRSTSAYTQSTTAKVLNTGTGTYSFDGCEFRNLLGELATLNNGLEKLVINGGLVSGCDANATSRKRFNVVTTQRVSVSVKGVSGFGYKTSDATNQLLVLPYWGGCIAWRVAVQGNINTSSDAAYGRQEEGIFSVSYAFNGVDKRMYADKVMLWETPTRTIPGDLASVVCFGTASGGAATGAADTPTSTGSICIAVPVAAAEASAFEWFAETAT